LAECENPTAFTKEVEYLLSDRERAKKLGNALHDTIEKKYSAQIMATSDLDLVPLVSNSAGGRVSLSDIAKELKELLGFHVEVHTVLSFDGKRFDHSVPFYGGGGETNHWFSSNQAVRIPID